MNHSAPQRLANPLRLLVVVDSLEVGGAERHLALVLPRLRERGIEPAVYVLGRQGRIKDELVGRGIPVIGGFEAGRFFRFIPPGLRGAVAHAATLAVLATHMMRARPDVCHFFLPRSCVLGSLAARVAGIKAAIASRRSLSDYQRAAPWLARAERYLIARLPVVLGNSPAVVARLVAEGVSPSRIGLIYNGVAMPAGDRPDREGLRRREGISDDTLVLLAVANLIPYKGHVDLLEAMGAIRRDALGRWLLLFAGRDDGIGGELARRAADLGIGERVRLLGDRADVSDLYALSDLVVLPSHQEGMPNVVLEAMAAGRPVIGTDVGGTGAAIADGITGRLVPPRDPASLRAAILDLAQDEERRRAWGRAGRARAEANFSIDSCVARYEALYRGLALHAQSPVEELIASASV